MMILMIITETFKIKGKEKKDYFNYTKQDITE